LSTGDDETIAGLIRASFAHRIRRGSIPLRRVVKISRATGHFSLPKIF